MVAGCGGDDEPAQPARETGAPTERTVRTETRTERTATGSVTAGCAGPGGLRLEAVSGDVPCGEAQRVAGGYRLQGPKVQEVGRWTCDRWEGYQGTRKTSELCTVDPATLGLSARYGASWCERVQSLLQTYGPFTLAFFEALLRVADARGKPPSIPFWLGEAPGRTDELSQEVSRLRADLEPRLADPAAATAWLETEVGFAEPAARQIVEYLAAAKAVLGVLPTRECLVLERFFDEAGGMQLVLHAPFGSRLNRAWGLALRKRFCRSFNFELQAAATEDAIVISLGPHHSFPLEDVFRFLSPDTVRHILIQAMLDAPMFPTRWRWNATRALALLRFVDGRRVPPQIQRMRAEDLLAAVFPAATACQDNHRGDHADREPPDHPLVAETVRDCLTEAMDVDGLAAVLRRIEAGELRCVAVDTPAPSPFCHEILNANPYAYLDDAPLEERRARAVEMRRSLPADLAGELGALDPAAIGEVAEEAWPVVRDADELHDALLTLMLALQAFPAVLALIAIFQIFRTLGLLDSLVGLMIA